MAFLLTFAIFVVFFLAFACTIQAQIIRELKSDLAVKPQVVQSISIFTQEVNEDSEDFAERIAREQREEALRREYVNRRAGESIDEVLNDVLGRSNSK